MEIGHVYQTILTRDFIIVFLRAWIIRGLYSIFLSSTRNSYVVIFLFTSLFKIWIGRWSERHLPFSTFWCLTDLDHWGKSRSLTTLGCLQCIFWFCGFFCPISTLVRLFICHPELFLVYYLVWWIYPPLSPIRALLFIFFSMTLNKITNISVMI